MSQFFCIRWPKYWSLSFNISPSIEYSGLISFRIDWFDLLAVQRTLKSLLQHHSSKAPILQLPWWLGGKESACNAGDQETWMKSLGWENPLEEEMYTHSSILAWRIPCTEDSGGLQSLRFQRVVTTEQLSTHAHIPTSQGCFKS